MVVGIEALFTSALGLQAPWSVKAVELDTARRAIDFKLSCAATTLPCPERGMLDNRGNAYVDAPQYSPSIHRCL